MKHFLLDLAEREMSILLFMKGNVISFSANNSKIIKILSKIQKWKDPGIGRLRPPPQILFLKNTLLP